MAPIAIFGHSHGGLSALRSAADDSRLRSVMSFAAPTDIPRYVTSVESFSSSRYRDIIDWIGGTPAALPERYALLRGLSYADRIRRPVLHIQGTLDMMTPLDHALWMERGLRRWKRRCAGRYGPTHGRFLRADRPRLSVRPSCGFGDSNGLQRLDKAYPDRVRQGHSRKSLDLCCASD